MSPLESGGQAPPERPQKGPAREAANMFRAASGCNCKHPVLVGAGSPDSGGKQELGTHLFVVRAQGVAKK